MERLRRSPILFDILLPLVATRLALLVIAFLAISFLSAASEITWIRSRDWLDLWARWDSGHYLGIVSNGYSFVEGQESNVAFFPLYPLIIWVLSFGSERWETAALVGWLVANTVAILALIVLRKLILLDQDERTARRAIWGLLLFPTGYYLSAVYTESLFLMLAVLAFYSARRGRWWLAGLFGGLGAATRIIGVFLLFPLAYEWRKQRSGQGFLTPALLLVPAGLLAYMLYLQLAFGNSLVFTQAASSWGRVNGIAAALELGRNFLIDPLATARSFGSTLDFTFVVLAGLLSFHVARRLPRSYLIYTVLALLVPLATLRVTSFSRYFIVVFPVGDLSSRGYAGGLLHSLESRPLGCLAREVAVELNVGGFVANAAG